MRVAVLLKGFLLLSISAIFFIQPAYATGGMGIMPSVTNEYPNSRSWFIYEAEPNTTIKDSVTLTNHLNHSIILQIAALDGMATLTGGYTLVSNNTENKDIGSWINLDTNEVRLAPFQSRKVDFTIMVPDDVDVGSHPGGVAVWRIDNRDINHNSPVTIVTRIAARVYLTVPGDIVKDLNVSEIKHNIEAGDFLFTLDLVNNGNVQLYPEVNLEIKNIFDQTIVEKTESLGLILKNGETQPSFFLGRKLPMFGKYVANFHICYGYSFIETQATDDCMDIQYVFWTIPWISVGVVLGVLILILMLYAFRKSWLKAKRLNTKTKKHIIKSGETLTSIAKRYNVDAKKMSRFNLLKWPYDLYAGDILLIPLGVMTKIERLSTQNKKTLIKLESVIIEKGDTVKDVAMFAGTDVAEIIEINHLRWPYKLKDNRELLIPVAITETKFKKQSGKKTKK